MQHISYEALVSLDATDQNIGEYNIQVEYTKCIRTSTLN